MKIDCNILSKEDALELTLLRDSLAKNLEFSCHVYGGKFMTMNERDRAKWLAVVEKILEQCK